MPMIINQSLLSQMPSEQVKRRSSCRFSHAVPWIESTLDFHIQRERSRGENAEAPQAQDHPTSGINL